MNDAPHSVAIALGSNLGDRRRNLEAALSALAMSLSIERLASLYETEASPDRQQRSFLNSALLASTKHTPEDLLAILKCIERGRGRRRGRRWGPRVLDLDLLVHGSVVRKSPELTLPHPLLGRRRFVLDPLAEIAPELEVPPHGVTVRELQCRRLAEPAPRKVAPAGVDAASWA